MAIQQNGVGLSCPVLSAGSLKAKNAILADIYLPTYFGTLIKMALRNNLWASSQATLAWAKQLGAPEGKITPLVSLIWPSAQPVLPSPGEIFFVYQKIFRKNTM